MLSPGFTRAFREDRKRAGRRGKDLGKLNKLMRRLAGDEQLEARFKTVVGADHRPTPRDRYVTASVLSDTPS